MTAAVWQMPTLKRGRHAASQGPTHADWLATIATGWRVQRDPEDGPIFCRWVPVGMDRARNTGDWWQVLLGPDDGSGVWLVRAGLCTATEWERYTGDRRTREQAAQRCRPMSWM